MAGLDKKDQAIRESEIEGSGANSLASRYGISEKKLLAKLDFHLLPGVILLYLLSFLDRSNVANARVEGLATDIGITGNQYLTGLTLFFIGYILFEVPYNIILKRTTPKFWLPTITIIWGIITTLQGIVHNEAGFFVIRTFLGIAEGGLFPGVVFYLSMWYKRQERQFRVALFFSAASLAGAFGGILAWGIAHMAGIVWTNGWRWIFILEGIATVIIGAFGYLFITNYPSTARWLSADEKQVVAARLAEDSDADNTEGFKWSNVTRALTDPKVWLYCAAYHTLSLPLYTLSLFFPTIIQDLGFTAAQAQLYTIPPYALATILTIAVAFVSERLKKRAPFMMASSSIAAIGYIILIANHETRLVRTISATTGKATMTEQFVHPWVSYVGTFFAAAGIYPSVAMALSWPAVNVSGQTKRAAAGGLQISIGNLGAVIGTQIYRTNFAPRYYQSHAVALAYLLANVAVSAFTWWYLAKQNRKRDAIEAAESVKEGEWKGDDDMRFRFTT